jgi:hypothetical protein
VYASRVSFKTQVATHAVMHPGMVQETQAAQISQQAKAL